jgi:hypothetical protein
MKEQLEVTVTDLYQDWWMIVVDGDPDHEVPAKADLATYGALDALPGNVVGARVRVERRDPQPPLIVAIVEIEET